ELLVVIAIIGTLVGLLLPAVQAARESGRRSQCMNNMKQLALGLQNYADATKALPPSACDYRVDIQGREGWSWIFLILPFIERPELHDAINTWCKNATSKGPSRVDAATGALTRAPIPQLICPTDTIALLAPEQKKNESGDTIKSSKTNYVANGGYRQTWCGSWGSQCALDQNIRASSGTIRKSRGVTFKDITDGVSKTFLIGEAGGVPAVENDAAKMPGIWVGNGNNFQSYQNETVRYASGKINNGTTDPPTFGSFHPFGAHFAMTDGSVRFIADTIDSNSASPWGSDASVDENITRAQNELTSASRGVFQRLSTRADGLVVGEF
ncbi:DUF1559 domain-containing protein, partial [bacterium]|nr:DUF1559 domain-containing protein [bacterium]